jgi:phage FluMu protein Com
MESKKCFQCDSELFSKVGGEPTKCPNCGALNEGLDQHENGVTKKRATKKHKGDDVSLLAGVIGSTLGD